MPELALTQQDGTLSRAEPALAPVRDRIREAREHRKPFELIWMSNRAFASGKVWNVVDPATRTVRRIQDMDPAFRGKQLYEADIVTEYRTTALGELAGDDDRPQLLLQRDDQWSEEYQAQANRALSYGWDYEWRGDDALAEADELALDFGTAAIQCRWNPNAGPVRQGDVPFHQGMPVFGMAQASELFANGPNPSVKMGEIREGRIEWIPRSAFNILVPPGIARERYFPWECLIEAAYLPDVIERFGPIAQGLREDKDIASSIGDSVNEGRSGTPIAYATGEARQTRVRDHVWLFSYFERPTTKYPTGRTIYFASNELKALEVHDGTDGEPGLPICGPDGSYRSGIEYLHWWRVTGRFWSRALVEALKDPARAISKRRTQSDEIIDRGMPYVLVPKGSEAANRKGDPVEVITVDYSGTQGQPIPVAGIGPGDWFYKDVAELREDGQHATGIRAPSLGENPANVSTYSQLALIHEADHTKRLPMQRGRKKAIARLIEDSVHVMRTWWGRSKQIMLSPDDESVQSEVFNATTLPPFYVVKIAKGDAKPRTQAARLKMIDDVAQYSLNSRQPVPVDWYLRSLEAGEPMELPEQPTSDQADKAELENHLLIEGRDVPVAYYDPPLLHVPIHRGAQVQAELRGDMETWQRIEAHVQEHLAVFKQNQQPPPDQPPGPAPVPAIPPGPPPGPMPPAAEAPPAEPAAVSPGP